MAVVTETARNVHVCRQRVISWSRKTDICWNNTLKAKGVRVASRVVRESESPSQLASINLLPGRLFCGVPPTNLIAYATTVYTGTWPTHTHKCEWLPCQHTPMPTYRHGSSWTSLRPPSSWTEEAPPGSLWVSPGASGGEVNISMYVRDLRWA